MIAETKELRVWHVLAFAGCADKMMTSRLNEPLPIFCLREQANLIV
jgi:hypothetical protein